MQQLTEPDERTNETGGQDAGRAVLYIRVSSSQQADNDYDLEGFSIPAQRDALQRKAASLGLQVVDAPCRSWVGVLERADQARPSLRRIAGRSNFGWIISRRNWMRCGGFVTSRGNDAKQCRFRWLPLWAIRTPARAHSSMR